MKISFGEWLKIARGRVRLSQKKLGDIVGVSATTIGFWENEKTVPTLTPSQTGKLCKALDVEFSDLLSAFNGEKETS